VSFLAPLYLALMGAVAVPLLLHLLRRRIGLRVEFPAARYIARAERENSRKLRLRNLLLMFVRIAIVLLLAAAAARPIGRLVGAGHVPTALAIVLDNSLSTTTIIDGAPLFTRLRETALQALRSAATSDRVWVVTADGRVAGGSRSSVMDAVQRTEPIAARGDLPAAVARAAGLVRSAGLPGRHVAILTDAQATAWSTRSAVADVAVSIFVPPVAPPANHAVIMAEARPPRWTPRGAVVARAHGSDSATYRITLGGRTLARGTVVGDEEILVRATPAERGWIGGTVELEPDELRGDDVRQFAVWIGVAPGIALDPAVGPFMRNAIDALMQNERLRTGTDIAVTSAENLTKLPALIFPPSDPVRLGAANRALERAGIPWRFGPLRREELVAREPVAGGAQIDGARVAAHYPLDATGPESADTLARVGGTPWIVAGDRYILLGSAIDPTTTNLPLRAGFLPWLADVVSQRLSGDAGPTLAAVPGQELRLPGGVSGLEDAAGQVAAIPKEGLIAPDRPGVYFLRRGASRAGALVVNSEPEESSLARLSTPALRDRFDGRDVEVLADRDRWVRDAFDAASGRPLVTPLLLLALGALVVEAILARGAGRAPAAGGVVRAAA
jgi:hypothetical protein